MLKFLQKYSLFIFFLFSTTTSVADYKVFGSPQNNNSGAVVNLPEPVVLCSDTVKDETSPQSYYEVYYINQNYDSGYRYNLNQHTVYYKGARPHYYSEWNCGACRGSQPSVLTYNGKEYDFKRGDEISRYRSPTTHYSWGSKSSTTTYYEFCLEPR